MPIDRKKLLQALAEYMRSEGCACCSDHVEHANATEALGRMLRVPKYKDGSGYNFAAYLKKEKP